MARALWVRVDRVMSSRVQGLMGELAFDESPPAWKDFDRRNWGKGASDGANAMSTDLEIAGQNQLCLQAGRPGQHDPRCGPSLLLTHGSWYLLSPSSLPPGSLWRPPNTLVPEMFEMNGQLMQCCDRVSGCFRCHFHHQLSCTVALPLGALDAACSLIS